MPKRRPVALATTLSAFPLPLPALGSMPLVSVSVSVSVSAPLLVRRSLRTRTGPSARFAARLLPIAAACLPLCALAQTTSSDVGASASTAASTLGGVGGTGGTSAAGSSGRRGLVFTPTAGTQETYSDNVSLSRADKHSDFATQASVGFRASSNSGRIRGSIDYSLTGTAHSSQVGSDQFSNALNANVTGELITNHLYVDVTGNISQQSLSAFGTQSVDTTSTNANRVEVSTFSVSPYLRGLITPYIAYQARLNGSWTSASSENAATSSQYGGLLHLGSAEPSLIGWAADASTSTIQYSQGSLSSTSDTYKGTLIVNPNTDVSMSLIGGVERNNYLSTEKKTYGDAGVALSWRPSPRTSLQARYEHRYFGNSHNIDFNYRTPRSAWNFIDLRDVTTSRTPTGGVFQQFTPLYLQLYSLFATLVPDPVQRDLAVRQFLAQNNLSPTITVSNLFLTSQVILQRTQALTFTLLGLRDTVVFRVQKTSSNGLGNAPITSNGLSTSNSVHQTGASVDFSHRLTPITSASTSLQYLRSSGDQALDTTVLKAIYFNLNTRVGLRGNLGVGVRHVIFDSVTSPYTENAIFANYGQTF